MNNMIMSQLDSMADEAAAVLAPLLRSCTPAVYKEFLNTMFHYTAGSEEKLLKAAAASNNPEIREFFTHMAKEERGHHLLAKADLEALGGTVTIDPPNAVTEFDLFWSSLDQQEEFLGALYVFENVASRVGADVKNLVERMQLGKLESRWLRLHAEADLEHGQEVKTMCEQFHSPATLTAAAKAKSNWISVFQNGLSNPQLEAIAV